MKPLAVTTSSKTRRASEAVGEAQQVAARLGVPFVPCAKGTPVEALLEQYACVLQLRGDGVVLVDGGGATRWTAGMADLRLHRLAAAIPQPDHVLLAGEVAAGDSVLDCTLGRGHDALVLERVAGRVVAVEKSLPLYAWTSEGLRRRGSRVECVHADAREVLRACAPRSFDCVFFDPMFSKPAHYEAGFAMVRRHAEAAPLDAGLLAEARRVARRWVVVKAAPQATDLFRLGLEVVPFKRSAELRFGRLSAA